MKNLISLGIVGLLAAQATAMFPLQRKNSPKTTPRLLSDSDTIKAYNLSVPIDHFHNDTQYAPHSNGTFNLRYYVDTSNYKPGGPVIVIAGGEGDASYRIPLLDHGIGSILTKATGGVGVILEHRYYGTSYPFASPSKKDLRFLSTEQAIADTAYFARNVKIPGLEQLNLTAPNTPWILYGCSYAGAFVALARKVYPETFWAAISSSGVTAAIYDYWAYNEAARLFGPNGCGKVLGKITHIIDTVLFSGNEAKVKSLKAIFGLDELKNDEFGATLWVPDAQGTSWIPDSDRPSFGTFCSVITSPALLFPSTGYLESTARALVKEAGLESESKTLTLQLLNYIGTTSRQISTRLQGDCKGLSQRDCFSARVPEDLEADDRSWLYQQCMQWGYFPSGAGVPKHIPSIFSRAVTLEYASIDCVTQFNITKAPDVESINKHGGLNFSYPRVAVIDGKQDPWRAATPHAIGTNQGRKSTPSEPYILIDPAVHHWDSFGLTKEQERPGLPPAQIKKVQSQEVEFVQAWLKEFKNHHKGQN